MIKGYADTAAGQIHFRRVAGPGAPIVLLHRTPNSSACFAAMLHRMAGRRAAIAFDTPGFGESFRPAGMPSAPDYAAWFLAAIDALGVEAFHLCAHHTGTHFAAEIAVLAPDRVRSLLLSGVLYASAADRAQFRAEIGVADRIEASGAHLAAAWTLMAKLLPDADVELVHAETMGALNAIEGRDQAFNAILSQDFAGVLARIACPVAIVQAGDDPLDGFLHRVRGRYPGIPIRKLGRAGLALPEGQPADFAAAALAFADAHDIRHPGRPMTDRRFELVRSAAGYDLREIRTATPEPGPGEILLRIRAVSVNRRDLSIRDLGYPVFDADHFTPMSDAAGDIVAIGEGVTAHAVGDRVCTTFFQNWPSGRISFPAVISALGAGGPGVLADHVLLSETGVAKLPAGWTYEEGACIPCAGVTAWTALTPLGHIQAGDWVLIIGTGGVAIFALQIAVALGAKVVILSSSDEKLARARAMGASATINYNTTPDWAEAVKAASGGGVHHAIELGGVGTLAKSMASMAVGGHVALIGALDGFGGDLSALTMIMSALRVSAVVVGSREDHVALTDFLSDHAIKPVIDSVFDVGDVEKAYARAVAGAFGKIVVRMD